MKYLKTFEFYKTDTGQFMDYDVGDTVICTNDIGPTKGLLNVGDKYKILKIYTSIEYKLLGKHYLIVDVENLETGKISKGWESTRFKLEIEDTADKYNL